ncbi:hypothetical protein R75461_07436 [Paraburkholderia nemoris]|nr:hypothetical protein R75461_07436 [Paraburkholderia nemoris]
MKLKCIAAAALVATGGAAYAQSSVTLYGTIDSGLLYQSTSAASFSPKAPNTGKVYAFKDGGIYASTWGLKGVEDIGGGYKINFKLQGVFNSGTGKLGLADAPGASAVFNQQTTVGVSGPFGTFDAGRQIVPMIYAMYDTDVRGAQYFGSILTAWLGMNQAAGWPGTSTNGPIGALYDDNALVYQSPKFYGAALQRFGSCFLTSPLASRSTCRCGVPTLSLPASVCEPAGMMLRQRRKRRWGSFQKSASWQRAKLDQRVGPSSSVAVTRRPCRAYALIE